MTPYKGIIRITCKAEGGCTASDKLPRPGPACINCADALVEVVDFEGKTLAKRAAKRPAPAKKAAKKTRKRKGKK